MNKVLLCETKTARTSYYFSGLHLQIESYEELCYIISKRMIYFFIYGIDSDLKAWLQDEYRLQIKSTDLQKQLLEIVQFKNFFTEGEIREIKEEIRGLFLQPTYKKYWMLGEDFKNAHQYVSAYIAYEKALQKSMQSSKEEQSEICYRMGLCLCHMFQYEEAKVHLKNGLELVNSEKCQKALDLILFLTTSQDEFMNQICESGRDKAQAQEIYEKFSMKKEQIVQEDEFVKLDKIAYHKRKLDDTMQNRLTKSMLEQWKDEYKREIS